MSFRVLTAEVSHETNTFSVRPTDFAAFTGRYCLFGSDAIAERGDANTDLAGFLDVASARGWRLTHALSAGAPPAGLVTRDAFSRITEPVLELAWDLGASLDGVLLSLHGAMVTQDSEDGEGALLALLRAVIGSDTPVAITLDPHANVTPRMCALADIIVSYKTYPHIDMRERARQAGEILHRAMSGEISPKTLRVHRPMLKESNGGRTDVGPMIARLAMARALEDDPDVFAVSINAGFASADIAEVGPTVLVTFQGDDAGPLKAAEAMADDIWDRRFENLDTYLSVEAAAARAKAHDGRSGPLVIADYADNPGGGAYGDSTALLAALLEAGVADACFGPMVDAPAVRSLSRCAVGDTATLALGGRTEPRYGGGPLPVTGVLRALSDGGYIGDGPILGGLKRSWGPTAVLDVAGVEILIVSSPSQIMDLRQFTAFGIDPRAKNVVALKSMQHFRAAFEPIAASVIVCDSGALCTPDRSRMTYKNARRPIFPLD